MSAELAENLPMNGEADRFEAQRQAFSRLMARFTADRDAMMGAVQQCNERVDSLASRLAGGGDIAPSVDGDSAARAAVSPGATGVAEVRSLTERFLAQQQHVLAEVRTASDRALQRAEEAQRRLNELSDLASQRDAGAEELKQAVDTFDDRLARLEEAFIAVDDKEAAGVDDEAVHLLAERVTAVEEQLRGIEESIESLRHAERALPADDGALSPVVSLGLRDLRDQMASLEGLVAWTPKLQRLWVSLVASAVVAAAAVVYVR